MWHYDASGNYTVSSGYWVGQGLERKPGTSTPGMLIHWWKNSWKMNIPTKIKIFMWRACNEWIPTNFNIARRGIQTNGKCAICKIDGETTLHALWECNRLKNTRKDWLSKNQGPRTDTPNFFDWVFDYFCKVSGKQKELFCMLLWRILFCRNSSSHEAKVADFSDTIGWSQKFQDDYHSSRSSNHPGTFDMAGSVQGSGPTNGWWPLIRMSHECKTNCGAVVDNRSGRVGFGIIIRNSIGDVMASCSQYLEANLSIKIAKLMAIQRGIQFGFDCSLTLSKIETDEAMVVKWINLGLNRDSEYGTILSDIDMMKSEMRNMCFRHIPLLANKAALSLAENVLSIAEDRFWMEEFPDSIGRIIQADKPG